MDTIRQGHKQDFGHRQRAMVQKIVDKPFPFVSPPFSSLPQPSFLSSFFWASISSAVSSFFGKWVFNSRLVVISSQSWPVLFLDTVHEGDQVGCLGLHPGLDIGKWNVDELCDMGKGDAIQLMGIFTEEVVIGSQEFWQDFQVILDQLNNLLSWVLHLGPTIGTRGHVTLESKLEQEIKQGQG